MDNSSYFKLLVILLVLIFGQLVRSEKSWCTPNETMVVNCNVCSCISDGLGGGLPVCTKLDCAKTIRTAKEKRVMDVYVKLLPTVVMKAVKTIGHQLLAWWMGIHQGKKSQI